MTVPHNDVYALYDCGDVGPGERLGITGYNKDIRDVMSPVRLILSAPADELATILEAFNANS